MSWCIKSLKNTPDLKTLSSSTNNWGKSNNILFALCATAFLPYRELDERIQSRSQDIILPYFNFYGRSSSHQECNISKYVASLPHYNLSPTSSHMLFYSTPSLPSSAKSFCPQISTSLPPFVTHGFHKNFQRHWQ